VINLTVVEYNKYHWRSLYFIGCGLSCAAAIVRASFPESQQFLLALEEAKTNGLTSGEATRNFLREMKIMLKTNWLRCIWGVCMSKYSILYPILHSILIPSLFNL